MATKWEAVYNCANNTCLKELNTMEMYRSQGVCPYCGLITEGTKLDVTKTAREVDTIGESADG